MAVVQAELRKIRSVRMLVAFPAASVLYGLVSFGPALAASKAERALMPDTLLGVVRGPGFFLAVAMLVFGALAAAGEFRHGTISATLTVSPRRRSVVAGKTGAVALVAASTALAVEAVTLSLGAWLMHVDGVTSSASIADLATGVAAVVVVAVLYGVAGVMVGLAVRDQTGAVTAVLVWVLAVEGVIPVVLRRPWLFRWLPGGAANAVLGVADPPGDLLPAWAGALLLTGAVAALAAVGSALFTTKDVATVG